MSNADFFQRAYSENGPKVISGFSRPVYHNLMGVLYGHQFDKMGFGGMIRHTEAGMLYEWASEVPQGHRSRGPGPMGSPSTCRGESSVLSRERWLCFHA